MRRRASPSILSFPLSCLTARRRAFSMILVYIFSFVVLATFVAWLRGPVRRKTLR